jgi:CubicO group peptidase (beta-lactamase class C family)
MKSHPGRAARIASVAQEHIDAKLFPNIAWRVALGDDIISEGGLGFQDAALSAPLLDNAIYRIYSMTKPLVSIAALQLI